MKRIKLLYQSDFSLAKTGFGRVARALLTYLYNTNKYDIVHYCCGLPHGHPELKKTPWKSIGTLPNTPQEIEALNKDPQLARMASYGAHRIDEVIKEEKPDVYIAVQDIWGVDFAIEKPWFNNITSVIWTTLDSLPILPTAVEKAKKIKNYWIWSDFATKALNELGHNHVKTMHGPLDTKNFFKLNLTEKQSLRKKFNIPLDAFIIGFVFRNQLRKSVPNLLEGYAAWKRSNPQIKNTFLLLHTHWSEGWNIYKLADELGVPKEEIITTYICRECGNYEIKQFSGQDIDCPICNSKKSQTTTSVALGVSEEQLNEIYNLMDVYCHPFTSGGQEIPIQEAKLTELITLVTNYSCGEEMCQESANSLALDWSDYREHGTEFIKASTRPNSIAKQLNKVYNMPLKKREEMGKKAREWTLTNFSVENVGKDIEFFIDSSPKSSYDFSSPKEERDPYMHIPDIKDDSEWLIYMYNNVLKMKGVDQNNEGHIYWMKEFAKGAKRRDIENYFRQVALQENQKIKDLKFEDLLDQSDIGRRLLFVMPQSAGDVFWTTSLLKSIKDMYPEFNIYYATKKEYMEILDGNPYIHKVLEYNSFMDNLLWAEGVGDHNGHFEIAFLPFIGTQRVLNYLHNGKDKLAFSIKE